MAHVIDPRGVDLGDITNRGLLDYYQREPGYTVGGVTTPANPARSSADILPVWAANTIYVAQQEILDPTGTTILVRTTTGTSRSTYDATEQGQWSAAGAGGGGGGGTAATLVPTAVKTANYTAAASDFVPVDTTSGSVTVTLPTAPADKTQVEVKHVVRGGSNTVTIAAGGTDKFNVTGGSTTASLSLLREAATYQYAASPGLWYALNNDLPLSQLTPAAIGAEPVHLFGTLASRPSATGSKVLYTATDDNGGTTYLDSASGTWTRTGGPVIPVSVGGPAYNMRPGNFSKWRKALSNVRNGSGYAKVLIIGDSTSWQGGTGNIVMGSWPKLLQQLLNTYYVPTTLGLAAYGTIGGASADTRWTLGTGWSLVTGSNSGFADASLQAASGAAGSVTFTPGYACDTFDIYYYKGGLGSANASIDGGSTTACNGGGANGVGKTTVTAGSVSSSHVLMINGPTGGAFAIFAVDAYDSTTKSVRMSMTGATGSTSTTWADNAGAYSSLGVIKAYAPDLTIMMLGINDAAANVTASAWQTLTQTLITAAQLSGDVIINTVIPSSSAFMTPTQVALEVAYASTAQTLAAANNCGVIDINSRFVDYTTANASGFMTDGAHTNVLGNFDIAQAIMNTLKTI